MIILFQNILFIIKEFFACNDCLELFTKIEKDLKLKGFKKLLVHIFCIIFPWKCSLCNTLLVNKVSISYLFSFSRHQTKCFIKIFFIDISWRGGKGGGRGEVATPMHTMIKGFALKFFFVFSANSLCFKSLGFFAKDFWIRADFLYEARWCGEYSICKINSI